MIYDIRAYVALLLFVPIATAIFLAARNRLGAVICVYFGGLLFLPELAAFDFPFLPPMDKNGFAGVMAFVAAMVTLRPKMRATKALRGVELFMLVIIAGNFGTALTNPDPIFWGERIVRRGFVVAETKALSGLVPYDFVSMTIRDLIYILLPFHLGRSLIRSRDDGILFMKVIAGFGLIYVPFMAWEMRMAPTLHADIYGYMGNSFAHAVRGEGFKPIVFLKGGLPVAMFTLAATLCAAGLVRLRQSILVFPAAIAVVVLWVMLILSRNVGAALYSLSSVPLVLLSRGKLAGRYAMILVGLVCAYPVLRATDVIPTREIAESVAEVSPERAQSLYVRFVNEDVLMERAWERPAFGWGGYGRNRIYNKYGQNITITDGEWVIRLGGRGIVGLVGSFGLLLAPIVVARRRMKKIDRSNHLIVDTLTLVVALNAVDLLPNGLFSRMPFFMAGALLGLSQGLSRGPPGEPPDR